MAKWSKNIYIQYVKTCTWSFWNSIKCDVFHSKRFQVIKSRIFKMFVYFLIDTYGMPWMLDSYRLLWLYFSNTTIFVSFILRYWFLFCNFITPLDIFTFVRITSNQWTCWIVLHVNSFLSLHYSLSKTDTWKQIYYPVYCSFV